MAEIEQVLRLSPSGPEITNTSGGPLSFGPGARVRLADLATVLGAVDPNRNIPTLAAIVTISGFGGTPVTVELPNPKPGLYYRASVQCDITTNTDDDATVQFFLDVNVDPDSPTWTNVASNTHLIAGPPGGQNAAAQLSLNMMKTLGSALGIVEATESLLVRVRMACPQNPIAQVYSPATPAPGAANSMGTFYLVLEEMF